MTVVRCKVNATPVAESSELSGKSRQAVDMKRSTNIVKVLLSYSHWRVRGATGEGLGLAGARASRSSRGVLGSCRYSYKAY
jgi:hypothetical protein